MQWLVLSNEDKKKLEGMAYLDSASRVMLVEIWNWTELAKQNPDVRKAFRELFEVVMQEDGKDG